MTIQNHMEKLAKILKDGHTTQYNIVLKKTPPEGCLSIDDVIRMSRMLTGIDMVPITIRGKHHAPWALSTIQTRSLWAMILNRS